MLWPARSRLGQGGLEGRPAPDLCGGHPESRSTWHKCSHLGPRRKASWTVEAAETAALERLHQPRARLLPENYDSYLERIMKRGTYGSFKNDSHHPQEERETH